MNCENVLSPFLLLCMFFDFSQTQVPPPPFSPSSHLILFPFFFFFHLMNKILEYISTIWKICNSFRSIFTESNGACTVYNQSESNYWFNAVIGLCHTSPFRITWLFPCDLHGLVSEHKHKPKILVNLTK